MLYDLSATIALLTARKARIEAKIRRATAARESAISRSRRVQTKARATFERRALRENVVAWHAYRRASDRLASLHEENVRIADAIYLTTVAQFGR